MTPVTKVLKQPEQEPMMIIEGSLYIPNMPLLLGGDLNPKRWA